MKSILQADGDSGKQTDGHEAQPATLTTEERNLLYSCEQIIRGNVIGFYQTGTSLAMIRDGRLYRETHPTFDAYLAAQFDMSRARACQLIGAAAVVDHLRGTSTIVNVLPATESQVRPLLKLSVQAGRERVLDLDTITAAWSEVIRRAPTDATGSPTITAKLVALVVRELLGEDQPQAEADALDVALAEIEDVVIAAVRTIPNTSGAYEAIAMKLRELARKLEIPG
jgi:hypothetical protein